MKKNMAKKISTEPKMNYDLNLLQDMYKKMLLIRRFEEKAGQLYGWDNWRLLSFIYWAGSCGCWYSILKLMVIVLSHPIEIMVTC